MNERMVYLSESDKLFKTHSGSYQTGVPLVMRETSTYAAPRAVPVRDKKYENETLAVPEKSFGK